VYNQEVSPCRFRGGGGLGLYRSSGTNEHQCDPVGGLEDYRAPAEENKTNAGLRVFVQGGGCSGFQHGLMIDEGERARLTP
jgi:hypothetical protein